MFIAYILLLCMLVPCIYNIMQWECKTLFVKTLMFLYILINTSPKYIVFAYIFVIIFLTPRKIIGTHARLRHQMALWILPTSPKTKRLQLYV